MNKNTLLSVFGVAVLGLMVVSSSGFQEKYGTLGASLFAARTGATPTVASEPSQASEDPYTTLIRLMRDMSRRLKVVEQKLGIENTTAPALRNTGSGTGQGTTQNATGGTSCPVFNEECLPDSTLAKGISVRSTESDAKSVALGSCEQSKVDRQTECASEIGRLQARCQKDNNQCVFNSTVIQPETACRVTHCDVYDPTKYDPDKYYPDDPSPSDEIKYYGCHYDYNPDGTKTLVDGPCSGNQIPKFWTKAEWKCWANGNAINVANSCSNPAGGSPCQVINDGTGVPACGGTCPNDDEVCRFIPSTSPTLGRCECVRDN